MLGMEEGLEPGTQRVLSNLMLIREAWKAARSRWLGTHDQMSTHFLEANIYK